MQCGDETLLLPCERRGVTEGRSELATRRKGRRRHLSFDSNKLEAGVAQFAKLPTLMKLHTPKRRLFSFVGNELISLVVKSKLVIKVPKLCKSL